MRTKRNDGFTLVEILIVVVILGILAAIVIPQFSQASTDAKTSSLASNLQTIRSQIALYKIQNDDVPPAVDDFETEMVSEYLQSVPVNPLTSGNGVGAATDDWHYTVSGSDYTFEAGDGSVSTAL